MKAGDPLERRRIAATQHFTEPPPRYSEASLVKRMEELGIGRPSTYAAVLQTLRDREYVKHREEAPRARGQGPHRHGLPGELLPPLRGIRFHGRPRRAARPGLEQRDRLEAGHARVLARLLRRHRRDEGAAHRRRCSMRSTSSSARTSSRTRATARNPRTCPTCGTGQLSLKLGKFGAFIGCSNYPGMQIHPPARRHRRRRRRRRLVRERRPARREGAGRRSRDRRAGDPARWPLRPLRPARRRREAQALLPAQGA